MVNKKGFELAISTIIILVLAIIILVALVIGFTIGFQKFWEGIKGVSGSESDNIAKMCRSQCDLENKNSFCCENKTLNGGKIKCSDGSLGIDCNINCDDVAC